MAKTPEGAVKAAIEAALVAERVYPFKKFLTGEIKPSEAEGFYFMPVAGRYSILGIHDIIGCWHGRFFSLETKSVKNSKDNTYHQGIFQIAVQAAGGLSFVGVRDASVVKTLKELVYG